MSRKEDVVHNFIYTRGCAGLNEDSKRLLSDAVRYGFEQGESFGRYEKYVEKVEAECLIQPENDRVWKEQLEAIQKDKDTPNPAWKSEKLLELIAEMILYRRNGG